MLNPLLARVPREKMPADFQNIFDGMVAQSGEGVITEVFALHPDLFRFYYDDFYGLIFDKTRMLVDDRTKELVRVKLSKENGCHVCNSFNVPSAIAAGLTREQIEHIFEPSSELFSEQDMTVLEWASEFEVANPDAKLSRQLHGRLRKYFGDAQILELAFFATMLSGFTRLMFALDIVSKDPVCAIRPPTQPSTKVLEVAC